MGREQVCVCGRQKDKRQLIFALACYDQEYMLFLTNEK